MNKDTLILNLFVIIDYNLLKLYMFINISSERVIFPELQIFQMLPL
jgi:hypothetical protein